MEKRCSFWHLGELSSGFQADQTILSGNKQTKTGESQITSKQREMHRNLSFSLWVRSHCTTIVQFSFFPQYVCLVDRDGIRCRYVCLFPSVEHENWAQHVNRLRVIADVAYLFVRCWQRWRMDIARTFGPSEGYAWVTANEFSAEDERYVLYSKLFVKQLPHLLWAVSEAVETLVDFSSLLVRSARVGMDLWKFSSSSARVWWGLSSSWSYRSRLASWPVVFDTVNREITCKAQVRS